LRIFRLFAASPIAERVDAGLSGGFYEPRVGNTKIASEANSLQEGPRLGRNNHAGAEVDIAVQGRLRSAHEKAKNILNAAVADREIDRGGFAVFARMAGDFAFGENISLHKGRADAIEGDITIGAIHKSVEFAADVYGMVSVRDVEIGNIDRAARFNTLQDALKTVVGGKDSADAFKYAEVGVAEIVFARDGSLPGIRGIPRAETSVRVDITGRKRNVHADGVGHGIVATEVGNP